MLLIKSPTSLFQLIATVWVPPLQVKKLWDVERRHIIDGRETAVFYTCEGSFRILSTLNLEISCDLDFAKYPFDRQASGIVHGQ